MRSKRSNRRRSRKRETTRRRSSKRVTNRRRRRSNQRVTNRRGKKRRSKKGRSGETLKELYYVQTEFPYQGVGMGASIMNNALPTNLVKIIGSVGGGVKIDVSHFAFDYPLDYNEEIYHETKSGAFIGTVEELKANLVPINSAADLAKYFADVGYDESEDAKKFFDTVWESI